MSASKLGINKKHPFFAVAVLSDSSISTMAFMPGLPGSDASQRRGSERAAQKMSPPVPQTVRLDRVLEHMTVEEARELLARHTADVASKQAELRSMVSSRYHELIESADGIVSMKQLAKEVMELLEALPAGCDIVLRGTAAFTTKSSTRRTPTSKTDTPEKASTTVAVATLLNAPAAIWLALDGRRFSDATALYLRSLAVAAADTAANVAAQTGALLPDPVAASFIQSQLAAIAQFPTRIIAGARQLIERGGEGDVVGALTALALLSRPEGGEGGERNECSVLEDMLQLRAKGLARRIRSAGRVRGVEGGLQRNLCAAVALIQATVMDVYEAFTKGALADRCRRTVGCTDGNLGGNVGKIASPPLTAVTSLVTSWLAAVLPKAAAAASSALLRETSAVALAAVRAALWKACGGDGTIETEDNSQHTRNKHERKSSFGIFEKKKWAEACSSVVDIRSLERSFRLGGGEGRTSIGSLPLVQHMRGEGGALELWPILFGGTFAEVAQSLLRGSLESMRAAFEEHLTTAVETLVTTPPATNSSSIEGTMVIIASSARAPAQTVAKGSAKVRNRHPASSIITAAAAVSVPLGRRLQGLAEEASGLVQSGDVAAEAAVQSALHQLTAELAVAVLVRLRISLADLKAQKSSSSSADLKSAARSQGLPDAVLLIGRIASLLLGPSAAPLRNILQRGPDPKGKLGKHRSMGSVALDQLEAAFEIADTNGEGVLDADEVEEAFQAIASGATLPLSFPSVNFSEFALLCTSLLGSDGHSAPQYFESGLKSVVTTACGLWAEWASEGPAAEFKQSAAALSSVSVQAKADGTSEGDWRGRLSGIPWKKQQLILSDGDEGQDITEEVWIPSGIWPPLLRFVLSVSEELSWITCTADLPLPLQDSSQQNAVNEFGLVSPASKAMAGCVVRHIDDVYNLFTADAKDSLVNTAPELAKLQILVDALFLRGLEGLPAASDETQEGKVGRELWDKVEDLVDPIDLQTLNPHLRESASVALESCWLLLPNEFKYPAGAAATTGTQRVRRSLSHHTVPVGGFGFTTDSSNGDSTAAFVLLILAPRSQRLELLPMAYASQPTGMRNSSLTSSTSRVTLGDGEEKGEGGGAGLQAVGRSAIAGIMGQVGNVQSIFEGGGSLLSGALWGRAQTPKK